MQDLAAPRGWVVNLSEGPLEIARGIRMAGLREFLASVDTQNRPLIDT
jgi:hypothetical protein